MKKICFFSGDITRSGGTERVGTVIANELHKKGQFEISIVSLWEDKKKMFFHLEQGIKRDTLFSDHVSGKKVLTYVKAVKKYVESNRIDVLVDIDGILDLYSIPALKKNKCKLVSWEQFSYYISPFVSYRKYTRKMAAKKANAIVVLTESDKNNYLKELEISGEIRTIYNPVEKTPSIINYDDKSKTIITVGRLSPDKGFDMLVKVASKVFDKHNDWKWIIIGNGEEEPMIREGIKKNRLEENLFLLGKKENLLEYYRKSALYVATSRYEGFGLTLLEAKNAKLPCVSFNCPEGPKEIIRDGVNGYLVDCFDIEQMAGKINELIENENKRKLFSENALVGTEKFKIEEIVEQWSELFTQLLTND